MFALWHAKTRIACMRSPNLWCHFVGNAHLLLHAHFHCNPLLPASRNVSLGVLCAQLRALCARHPNTNDVILLVTPISSFMLIFIAILRFQPSEIANLCFLVCSAHNYAYSLFMCQDENENEDENQSFGSFWSLCLTNEPMLQCIIILKAWFVRPRLYP